MRIQKLIYIIAIALFTFLFSLTEEGRADKPVDQSIQQQSPSEGEPQPAISTPLINPQDADPDLEPGFPVTTLHTPGTYMGGPVINTLVGNIDSDPALEILVTGLSQGPLYAWNSDGSLVPGWPVYYYNRAFYTSLGNLSDEYDGLEVFTGQFIYRVPETPPGPIMALSGAGTLLPGWPRDSADDIYAPAALADVDRDGLDEIFIFEIYDTYAYKADGTPLPGWPVGADDAGMAIGDLDGDGDPEIVNINNTSYEGGYLVAYHHDGSRVNNLNLFYKPYRHPTPVIGDVDGDRSPEIIVISHYEEPPLVALVVSPNGSIEQVLSLALIHLSAYMEACMAPVLADMDGDQIPEIVIGYSEGIIIYRGDGTVLPGWPVMWSPGQMRSMLNNCPVVGDVDGDQSPDVVIPSGNEVYVFDWQGNLHPRFPKQINIGFGAVPAIADIDLDGRNEIIVTGSIWEGFSGNYDKVWAYDLGGIDHGRIEWGQYAGGPQHLNYYPPRGATPGVDLYIKSPGLVGVPPASLSPINIQYGNLGDTLATSVTVTATLGIGLTYISDTSGITPTVNGQNIVWELPNAAYPFVKGFTIVVQPPLGAFYGDTYSVVLSLDSKETDINPSDNNANVTVLIARQVSLPLIKR